MRRSILSISILVFLSTGFLNMSAQTIKYTMPEEIGLHEGTWLQWPHNFTYPPYWREDLESTWIEMTRELATGEKVHIIAYNSEEKSHIIQVLTSAGVSFDNVDFYIHPNNDVWVRDNGPIFVFDNDGYMKILDWGFNGWGEDAPFALCDAIPPLVSEDINIPYVDLSAMVLEGGSMELDGNGTLMATKSAIINADRNPFLSQEQIEEYMTINLGVTNFIWLDGVSGLEITDMHIDGFARFHDSTTIVTMDSIDLVYWEVPPTDISILYNAQNINGELYNYLYLPLTVNDVVTTWGQNLGYKGSYVNYYIANSVVLVPIYNDPNDNVAISILQEIYPTRTVVGIDVRNLYSQGGMIHCVTQQQPYYQIPTGSIEQSENSAKLLQNIPNPFIDSTTISFTIKEASFVKLEVFNSQGQKQKTLINSKLSAGEHKLVLLGDDFDSGVYTYVLTVNESNILSNKMIITKK